MDIHMSSPLLMLERHPYLPMNIHVLPLNVARKASTTTLVDTTNSINKTATALLFTHGHSRVLLSFEWCSQ
jgi:hypothetical protein